MLQTIRNAWKIADLRRKILFTLLILLLYRLGSAVPVPYINVELLKEYFAQNLEGTVFGIFNTMSGQAFSSATLFALSIQPYINASIIMQLLTIAIPALERLQKEGGEEGRKKIASITRYATVAIGLLQGFAYYVMVRNYGVLLPGHMTGIWEAIVIVLSFTTGSALIMWLGEQITEFGIGNGISIILFASIISRLPATTVSMVQNLFAGGNIAVYIGILAGVLAIIALIIFVNDAERRIGVQYSKRVVGRKMYGGQSTHLPMKVNMSGVMPIIFAQSIASVPATIIMFIPEANRGKIMNAILAVFDNRSVVYILLYFLLIIGFSFFYSTVQFNPVEIANNLKKNGGFITGFRPGRPTSDFIKKVLRKITLFGAIYLGLVAALPMVFGTSGSAGIALGGTSIIIVVGVALETMRALEAEMMMRHYKGFLE
jgi:preprotein translocase subunit SecY